MDKDDKLYFDLQRVPLQSERNEKRIKRKRIFFGFLLCMIFFILGILTAYLFYNVYFASNDVKGSDVMGEIEYSMENEWLYSHEHKNLIEEMEDKYGNYISPDDVVVDDVTGEIISVKGFDISGTTSGTTNVGNISGFRTETGDNFKVEVAGETYKVENQGKVTDTTTKEKLIKTNTKDGQVLISDGKMYAKYDDEYYEVGAREGLLNLGTTSGYKNLYGALTNKK